MKMVKKSYGYDANKNLILYTDTKGSQTAMKYDPLAQFGEKVILQKLRGDLNEA
ncbi:hypothetical protein RU86_GL001941 [Lactococcus piscium]|uniref:Uncharacterized protein n=2 Tax=Pseudolactococcus piscium TaxID=1364 RepID=A0A2A5RT59_9LACT|nr:hypothetical protein RU86_GL001941 [Lactococcus piscium]